MLTRTFLTSTFVASTLLVGCYPRLADVEPYTPPPGQVCEEELTTVVGDFGERLKGRRVRCRDVAPRSPKEADNSLADSVAGMASETRDEMIESMRDLEEKLFEIFTNECLPYEDGPRWCQRVFDRWAQLDPPIRKTDPNLYDFAWWREQERRSRMWQASTVLGYELTAELMIRGEFE